MNIHAIGWGILAMTLTIVFSSILVVLLGGTKGDKSGRSIAEVIRTLGFLIGLAVTLITW